MTPDGTLTWDAAAMEAALGYTPIADWFQDGRHVATLIENRLAVEQGFTRPPNKCDKFDLLDARGGKWEVRSITDKVNFKPSSMLGLGRRFKLTNWTDKLDSLSGFILTDIRDFPSVPYWLVPSTVVGGWWATGQLGKNICLGRKAIRKLLDETNWTPVEKGHKWLAIVKQ